MAFLSMDDLTTDAVRVTSNSTGRQVRVTWGATTVRLTVAEAVDLVDAIATELGHLPDDALSRTHPIPEAAPREKGVRPMDTPEEFASEKARVRADAMVRAEANVRAHAARESDKASPSRNEDRVRADAEVRESL